MLRKKGGIVWRWAFLYSLLTLHYYSVVRHVTTFPSCLYNSIHSIRCDSWNNSLFSDAETSGLRTTQFPISIQICRRTQVVPLFWIRGKKITLQIGFGSTNFGNSAFEATQLHCQEKGRVTRGNFWRFFSLQIENRKTNTWIYQMNMKSYTFE